MKKKVMLEGKSNTLGAERIVRQVEKGGFAVDFDSACDMQRAYSADSVCIHICMCVYTHIHTCVRMCIYIYVCQYTCDMQRAYSADSVYVCAFMYVYVCIYTYMCAYVYIYICMSIYVRYATRLFR